MKFFFISIFYHIFYKRLDFQRNNLPINTQLFSKFKIFQTSYIVINVIIRSYLAPRKTQKNKFQILRNFHLILCTKNI